MELDSSLIWWADVSTGAGLLITAIGAATTAKAVMLTPEDAVHIGVARYASGDDESDLQLPSVQNLLKSSKGAQRGLLMVVAGTALQFIPVAIRVLAPLV